MTKDFRKKRAKRKKLLRPFTSLADRRLWIGAKFDGTFNADPRWYGPMLEPGEKGKEAYLKAFGGKCGCGKPDAPNDLEMFAVLLNVSLPRGVDEKVMLHCDNCLPCLVWLGRMLHHFVADQPGSAWSAEVAKYYPLKVEGWENDKYHFRLFFSSTFNGPSFHVYALPFNKLKNKKPLIIGSCAGVLGDGEYPLQEMVLATQKEMLERAKATRDLSPALDSVVIVQFARALGFIIDEEIFEFISR